MLTLSWTCAKKGPTHWYGPLLHVFACLLQSLPSHLMKAVRTRLLLPSCAHITFITQRVTYASIRYRHTPGIHSMAA